jgi:hypothetical protein
MSDEKIYQLFWSNLRSHVKSKTPKVVKQYLDRLKCCIGKQDSIYDYDEESGCKVIRNDLLALAFEKGKPGFEYKERPECAAMYIDEKVVKLRKKGGSR